MLRLKDLMQPNVVAVSPDLTLRELLEVLTEQEVSGAPVVAGGTVIGVVSTTDIFDLQEDAHDLSDHGATADLESSGRRNPSSPEFFVDTWDGTGGGALELMRTARGRSWNLLDEYNVSDVMTREIISQPSSTSITTAARYMIDAGIRRILVIDDGILQGIVTTTDIMRAVAEGRLKG
ncbi:MAG: CBS domain-containing protein [Gemmatimonadota bacterium]|nr:MAG: CBS domain-containing protein [Gemmatimonadota bacterium]